MKNRYGVILHTDEGTRMAGTIYPNVDRAVGFAKEWEVCALKLGHADWRAEVVELRPIKKARGGYDTRSRT